MGHIVKSAENGEAALELLATFKPEIILLDLDMPGTGGYETAKRIREDPAYDTLQFVTLTGYGQEQDIQKTKVAGFDHHRVKPVDITVLETVLNLKPHSRE